jgi:hypothetical protein
MDIYQNWIIDNTVAMAEIREKYSADEILPVFMS